MPIHLSVHCVKVGKHSAKERLFDLKVESSLCRGGSVKKVKTGQRRAVDVGKRRYETTDEKYDGGMNSERGECYLV